MKAINPKTGEIFEGPDGSTPPEGLVPLGAPIGPDNPLMAGATGFAAGATSGPLTHRLRQKGSQQMLDLEYERQKAAHPTAAPIGHAIGSFFSPESALMGKGADVVGRAAGAALAPGIVGEQAGPIVSDALIAGGKQAGAAMDVMGQAVKPKLYPAAGAALGAAGGAATGVLAQGPGGAIPSAVGGAYSGTIAGRVAAGLPAFEKGAGWHAPMSVPAAAIGRALSDPAVRRYILLKSLPGPFTMGMAGANLPRGGEEE